VIEPGFPGPPPHIHEHVHDMFTVLDGALTVRVGDEELQAGPGTSGDLHGALGAVEVARRSLGSPPPSGR